MEYRLQAALSAFVAFRLKAVLQTSLPLIHYQNPVGG